jgi:hypothetical protein
VSCKSKQRRDRQQARAKQSLYHVVYPPKKSVAPAGCTSRKLRLRCGGQAPVLQRRIVSANATNLVNVLKI